ncbi:GbsR/MarR family transcriptional regulator [Archangium lansingense]|uniref:MarR family transcriptional regulator n=1 Tax=Archangium lansingense TaxID=2995310 RepID=A0ABT4AIH8_9BACT|nr:MarR family transcriptional regulator [Archangium lansinium]MCY1081496.1 MarR family transcriptional regulator [Archangium lansinium]
MAKESKKTRKADRAERDEVAVGRFVERFALIMSDSGFPRMPARVFVGLLIADEGRSTAAELAAMLHVSPAAISIAVRYLMQLGLVSREREPGERRDHYRVHNDMWYESLTRRDETLVRWEQGLEEGIAALGVDSPAGARLDETRRFFEFVRGEFPHLLRKWKEIRAAGRKS